MRYLLFGIILQLYRRKFQLTQAAVARKCGIPLKTYQHLEEAQHEPLSGVLKLLEAGTGMTFEHHDMITWIDDATADKLLGRESKIARLSERVNEAHTR